MIRKIQNDNKEASETTPQWVNPNDRLPGDRNWYICYVDGERVPLKYNSANRFWSALDGKSYPATGISKWLDA
jgi:hypothetical protein